MCPLEQKMGDLEANFLNLAVNDNGGLDGGDKKKEEPSFFQNAGKMRELFEADHKLKSRAKKGGTETVVNVASDKKEEEERVAIIRRYNEYLRNHIVVARLQKAGFRGKPSLDVYNCSLPMARSAWQDIEDCLSGDESRNLAFLGMTQLNAFAERMRPELAESPSLSEVFMSECQNEQSNMRLSMEELSIRLQPYTPGGFFARFIASYGLLVKSVADHRNMEQKVAMNTKISKEEAEEMEKKYSGL